MESKTKDKPQICRAKIEPVNDEEEKKDYDFLAVAVPMENGQVNYSWENDEYFNQVLVPTPENTRVKRLDSGLNLFDNHPYDRSSINTLGITTGYEFTERGLEVKCKFGSRADEALRSDVMNGIIKTVSVEGDIYTYEKTYQQGQLPVYRAIDWEPTSLSFAPVPQDIESQIEVKRKIQEQIKPTEIKPNKSIINSLKSKFK